MRHSWLKIGDWTLMSKMGNWILVSKMGDLDTTVENRYQTLVSKIRNWTLMFQNGKEVRFYNGHYSLKLEIGLWCLHWRLESTIGD